MPKTYEPPCHGLHQEESGICPGCLAGDMLRVWGYIPQWVQKAVERQQHLNGLRSIGKF